VTGTRSENGQAEDVLDTGALGDVPDGGDLLTAEDVVVRFHTKKGVVHAVEGVSLRLKAGEVLAVVGESGSGKTVFTRRAMGLIGGGRGTEVSGTVTYDGTRISELSGKQLSAFWGSEIALILQDLVKRWLDGERNTARPSELRIETGAGGH